MRILEKLRLMVLTVVIVNGFSRNGGLESVAGIGKLRENILLNGTHYNFRLQLGNQIMKENQKVNSCVQ